MTIAAWADCLMRFGIALHAGLRLGVLSGLIAVAAVRPHGDSASRRRAVGSWLIADSRVPERLDGLHDRRAAPFCIHRRRRQDARDVAQQPDVRVVSMLDRSLHPRCDLSGDRVIVARACKERQDFKRGDLRGIT